MAEGKASASSEPQLASDLADQALEKPAKTAEAAESLRAGQAEEVDDDLPDLEGEEEEDDDAPAEAGAEGSAKPEKKRKPKKKKKKSGADGATALAAASTEPKSTGSIQKPVDVKDLPALLKQLAMNQQPPKKEGKAPEDYKFWNTQPVPKFKEPNLLQTTSGSNGESLPEGAILPDKVCKASVKPDPEPLLEGFEWCLVDLDNEAELKELYDLLYNHYVEDTDGSFRFNYSAKFLAWALKPPGYRKDWHIGVRTKATTEGGKPGKLVAFIAGVPAKLRVRQATLNISEINFLTVHRKLRSKRLAPVLIKEVTRRCYQNDIYQALYTAGTLLPTPVTTARYFHRSLDWEHLYNTGFSHLPSGTTALRQKYKYRLESQTGIKGLRPMRESDVKPVKALLERYLARFSLRQEFEEGELEHWLCSAQSEGVVSSFVVEDPSSKEITDFVSYYLLEVSVHILPADDC